MLADGVERNVVCPLLKSFTIDAEAIVTCQRGEVGLFPRTVGLTHPLLNGDGLLLQALRLKGCHPRVDGQPCQVGNDAVAGRVGVRLQQFLVVVLNRRRNGQTQLWQEVALGSLNVTVGLTNHVKHHIVVVGIAVVPVQIPVAGFVVNLNIAHP